MTVVGCLDRLALDGVLALLVNVIGGFVIARFRLIDGHALLIVLNHHAQLLLLERFVTLSLFSVCEFR